MAMRWTRKALDRYHIQARNLPPNKLVELGDKAQLMAVACDRKWVHIEDVLFAERSIRTYPDAIGG